YSSLPPVLPVSAKDPAESSSTTHTTIVSPPLSQANEQNSHEAVQSYYDDGTYEWKILKMEQQADPKGADSEIAAEYATNGNSTFTNGHENSPHRNVDHLEGKILNGMAPIGRTESQIQGTLQSGYVPPIIQNSERSYPSQQQPNMVRKDEKIVWDPNLNRYVGEGIEEESVPDPPPSVSLTSEKQNGSAHGMVGGLTAARFKRW
uniref:ZM domain-containing protein n=1 Tax=Loa loa TaxID=7209 RepID=A0A1I7VTD1_LOALO